MSEKEESITKLKTHLPFDWMEYLARILDLPISREGDQATLETESSIYFTNVNDRFADLVGKPVR